jgi:hypothetical protein
MHSLSIRFTACAALLFAWGCGPTGPKKYPVTGTVKVDGNVVERVLVQFTYEGTGDVKGNDKYPSALTDASGLFTLGKGSDIEGAAAGEYVVTFSWMSGPELEAFDKFKGKLSDPTKSKHRVRVPEDVSKPLVFDLENPSPGSTRK